ncbi:unnamed protein product [Alternaria alternata]
MFNIIDDTFINLWNRADNSRVSSAWITQMQAQLSEAVPESLECTREQEVQIRITQQWLRSLIWQLSAEKVFDVACCLTDVMACTSLSEDAFAIGSRNYLPRFFTLIRILPEGQSRYLPILLTKLSEVVPDLGLPLSSYLPEVVSAVVLGPQAASSDGNDLVDYSSYPAAAPSSYLPNDRRSF